MAFPLRIIGLTGGIGSGKSTVARLLAARGYPVIDADALAREVVKPGEPAFAEIKNAWPDAIGPDGTLDRKALGRRVFADPAARQRLEAITHPRIRAALQAHAQKLADAGHGLLFYEASLLVETGGHHDLDGLIVVTATREQQLARTMARDRCTRAEAECRLNAQMPIEKKRAAATHVIDNSGTLEEAEAQVTALLASLEGRG